MRHSIPLIVLAAIGACVAPAEAQRRAAPDRVAEKAAKKVRGTEAHAASLFEIAKKLRRSGQKDVAAKIEAQARRLLSPGKKKNPGSRSGRRRTRARADVVDPRGLPKVKAKPTQIGGVLDSWRGGVTLHPVRSAYPVKLALPAKGAKPTAIAKWFAPRVAVPKVKAPKLRLPKLKVPKVKAPRVKAPKAGRWSVDWTVGKKWVSVSKARPTPGRVSTGLPMVAPTTNRDTVVSIPVGEPKRGSASVDIGRERFRYVPIATGRDAEGRVTWRGLPSRPTTAEDAPAAVAPVATKSPRGLERRVEALSREVRAMRATLERLTERLTKDRKKRLIR